MRASWVAIHGSHTHVAAMHGGILAAVDIREATWMLWIKERLVETGTSDTVQGAKVQASRAAGDWKMK